MFAVCLVLAAPSPEPVEPSPEPVAPTAEPAASTMEPVADTTCVDVSQRCNADADCCDPYDCSSIAGERGVSLSFVSFIECCGYIGALFFIGPSKVSRRTETLNGYSSY